MQYLLLSSAPFFEDNLIYGFRDDEQDARVTFRLQLLTQDKRIVGERSAKQVKRDPSLIKGRSGNVVYGEPYYYRAAQFLFDGISPRDVLLFHLEVDAK